jgi:hypothetical protein
MSRLQRVMREHGHDVGGHASVQVADGGVSGDIAVAQSAVEAFVEELAAYPYCTSCQQAVSSLQTGAWLSENVLELNSVKETVGLLTALQLSLCSSSPVQANGVCEVGVFSIQSAGGLVWSTLYLPEHESLVWLVNHGGCVSAQMCAP